MPITLNRAKETKPGSEARRLRITLHLSKPELAVMAGVSANVVSLFEHNLPVPLDARRRINKELWSLKSKK